MLMLLQLQVDGLGSLFNAFAEKVEHFRFHYLLKTAVRNQNTPIRFTEPIGGVSCYSTVTDFARLRGLSTSQPR